MVDAGLVPNTVLATFNVPTPVGAARVPIVTGRPTFILGRNGTGKSALVHHFVNQVAKSIYLPGSRPNYFDNESLQMTPATRRQFDIHSVGWDRQPQTRYRPISGTQRNEKAVHDLLSSEMQFKVDAANDIKAFGQASSAIAKLQSDQSPIDRVNNLLRQAGIPTSLVVHEGELMAQRNSPPFSIAKMSDGERAALIIAAEVVAAPPLAIFLVDEPELHLHRSIVVPLLGALLRERADCAFVVSTHELELPSANEEGIAVLTRSCAWEGDHALWWDIDIFPLTAALPEELRTDLLGSRRKILFIEGSQTSLDQPLYALLYPEISVRPRETARDVRHTVVALNAVTGIHRASVYGLIDNDTLSDSRIEELKQDGIFALPVASVEALYYCEEALTAVAQQQALTFGSDASQIVKAAKSAALSAIKQNDVQHLAARVAELKLRDAVYTAMPTRDRIKTEKGPLTVKVNSTYQTENKNISALIDDGDLANLIAHYPIRETGALTALAIALSFRGRLDYEKAFLARVAADTSLRSALMAKLGELSRLLS
jgi:predicted ATPase